MSITQKATIFKLLASLTTGVHQHVLVLLPGRLTGAGSLSTTDSCCFYDLGLEDGFIQSQGLSEVGVKFFSHQIFCLDTSEGTSGFAKYIWLVPSLRSYLSSHNVQSQV